MDQKQQDNFRVLLTEAIIKLCQMEAVYTDELQIEGTVCVVSDHASVMIAHFTECVADKRSDNSECVFEQHIADELADMAVNHSEVIFPEVKVEHELYDNEIMKEFEGGGEVDYGFCHTVQKSLSADDDNTTVNVEQSTGGQYQCLQCKKIYKLERTLQSHMKTHCGRQPHSCQHCSAAFPSVAKLHMHIRKEHDVNGQLSDKKLANRSRKHHQKHHHITPLATDQVNSVEYDSCLDTSICMPDDNEMTYRCLKAAGSDSLTLLEALERNDYETMIADTQLPTTEMNMAEQQTVQRQKDLAQQTHGSNSAKSHKHRNATKATIMQYFEKVHVETSRGLYQYQCCLCQKMFKLRTSLYEHISSHIGERRYACSHCGYRFVHHSSLHNHLRNKHMVSSQGQGTLRYMCTGCDRRFKFRSQLERHIRSNPTHCTKVLNDQ